MKNGRRQKTKEEELRNRKNRKEGRGRTII
jgi:hypothetical protein